MITMSDVIEVMREAIASNCDAVISPGFVRDVIAALAAAGYAVRPLEPTPKMIEAGKPPFEEEFCNTLAADDGVIAAIYRAMVAEEGM